MTEIIVPIDTLPTISDRSCWSMPCCEQGSMYCLSDNRSSLQERFEKAYENGLFSAQQWLQRNVKWIAASVFLIAIVVGIIIVVINNKSPDFPCISYSEQSLASSVSIACVQYMWTANCATRAPYTFPANYVGWWNRSPEGTTMVPCNGLKNGPACGVGSYSNMVTYMQFCNIHFNQ
jgi:hypothetical protein